VEPGETESWSASKRASRCGAFVTLESPQPTRKAAVRIAHETERSVSRKWNKSEEVRRIEIVCRDRYSQLTTNDKDQKRCKRETRGVVGYAAS
jgi:hypothetical protein